ncbi:GspE/PulE family protein [Fodinibius salsisoli]|uniref:Type II/IV secretion system protein n=1 Tax=Fodinibius salsisoli TaxID=2820877 RepID=A0ABT3PM63_9BACT|nr:GspE/PulE family protein [Fodinibius salsisoli]MCW9706808.1 type II/IV secretion system protein [Fodinibius salsisoli]
MGKVQTHRHIGEMMQENGIITQEQLDKARQIQASGVDMSTRKFAQILQDQLDVDRHLVLKSIADIFGIKEFRMLEGEAGEQQLQEIKDLLEELTEEVTNDFIDQSALPISRQNQKLVILTADPTNPRITDLAGELSANHFELVYCERGTLRTLIEQVLYKQNNILEQLNDVEIEEPEINEKADEIKEEELDAEINQSMLNKLVEGMLVEAVRRGASDVHVIPTGNRSTDIRFRIDGKLQLWHQQEKVKPEAIVAVVKDKTKNVDRFERDSSQDGFIQRKIDNVNIRFRVSIMPIVGTEFNRKFESVVIRILDDRKVITDLNKLGLQSNALHLFRKAINKPSGIVIITGPTGSGKSTSLIAALHHVMDPSKNVLTVEDPTEYIIKGARQLKINSHMTFDMSMRGILRHDPDIVLVGEIRDLNTAEIAIKLANTGHLTFSTLHTNDAPSAVSRLYKMGVEPFLIANAVNLIMAQRLVRKLCDHCKIEDTDLHPELARGIGFTDEEIAESTFYKARELGCDHCINGYKGRAAIIEALYFTKEIRNLILDAGANIDEEEIRSYAIKNGMMSLRASGRERVKEGLTSIEEILAMTVED